MIDQNRDGFIDSDDLKDMLASLGKEENLLQQLFPIAFWATCSQVDWVAKHYLILASFCYQI